MNHRDRKFEVEFFKQKSSKAGRPRAFRSLARTLNSNSAGSLNSLIYETKPILYSAFAFGFLRSSASSSLFVKYACLGILAFCAYIIYCRLEKRGYL
ncbi:MAG: hypothetical protein KDD38_10960 [Bdellovibrionales bacterium]|nr:hypothetical protein [Bdellovibrionales bacterium]